VPAAALIECAAHPLEYVVLSHYPMPSGQVQTTEMVELATAETAEPSDSVGHSVQESYRIRCQIALTSFYPRTLFLLPQPFSVARPLLLLPGEQARPATGPPLRPPILLRAMELVVMKVVARQRLRPLMQSRQNGFQWKNNASLARRTMLAARRNLCCHSRRALISTTQPRQAVADSWLCSQDCIRAHGVHRTAQCGANSR
jgi:hypothetical protein